MMYRSSDGRTFSTYQTFCQHQACLSQTDKERLYWLEEKEKMDKRQRSIGARIFLFILLPVTLPLCTLIGKPMNAINAVFGE